LFRVVPGWSVRGGDRVGAIVRERRERVAVAKGGEKKKTKPVLHHARLASLCYQFKLLPDANSPCRRPEFKFINAP